MYSKQCKLTRLADGAYQVSWLPEQYARVGKILSLSANGQDEGVWRVDEVGSRLHMKEVGERSRDYLKQRKASDI